MEITAFFQIAPLWNHWQNANSMITDGMIKPTVDNTSMYARRITMEMYTRFVPGVHIGSSGRSSFFIIRVPMISPTEQIRSNAAMIPGQSPGPGTPVP